MKKRHIVVISFIFLFLLGALLVVANHPGSGCSFPGYGASSWAGPLHCVWNVCLNDDGTMANNCVAENADIAANAVGVEKLNDAAGITDVLFGTQAMAAGQIAAGGRQDVLVTMTGLDITNDFVWCKLIESGDFDNVYIMSTELGVNQATVRVGNPTAGAINVEAGDVVGCMAFKRP